MKKDSTIQNNPVIGIIGTGNIARALGFSLLKAGYTIAAVYSRNPSTAAALARAWKCRKKRTGHEPYTEDILFFCVPDDALRSLTYIDIPPRSLCVHCSGTTPLTVFGSRPSAVLWPLQTFSPAGMPDDVSLADGPLVIEGSTQTTMRQIRKMAKTLSSTVITANTEKRMLLHLCAVFACNFPNHMYSAAQKLCTTNGLDFGLLMPLILKTAFRNLTANPMETQTGPAIRRDLSTLKKHEELLNSDPDLKKLYKSVTNSIFAMHKK